MAETKGYNASCTFANGCALLNSHVILILRGPENEGGRIGLAETAGRLVRLKLVHTRRQFRVPGLDELAKASCQTGDQHRLGDHIADDDSSKQI